MRKKKKPRWWRWLSEELFFLEWLTRGEEDETEEHPKEASEKSEAELVAREEWGP